MWIGVLRVPGRFRAPLSRCGLCTAIMPCSARRAGRWGRLGSLPSGLPITVTPRKHDCASASASAAGRHRWPASESSRQHGHDRDGGAARTRRPRRASGENAARAGARGPGGEGGWLTRTPASWYCAMLPGVPAAADSAYKASAGRRWPEPHVPGRLRPG